MIVDRVSREAYRGGEGPRDSGPLFFTSKASLEAYAETHGIEEFEAYEVPEGVLARMKGKPHWLDGVRKN
jgi:hypothetical protein